MIKIMINYLGNDYFKSCGYIWQIKYNRNR